jgi:uncharacterized protein YjbI with pentapeptide repeats
MSEISTTITFFLCLAGLAILIFGLARASVWTEQWATDRLSSSRPKFPPDVTALAATGRVVAEAAGNSMPSSTSWIARFQKSFQDSPWIAALSAVGLFATNVAIFFGLAAYLFEYPDRQKLRHFQAWQVIHLARGQHSEGGRIAAIRDLVKDRQSLDALNLEEVYLENGYFNGATLNDVSFKRADLSMADFGCAGGFAFIYGVIPWWKSCLVETFISNTDFTDTIISHTDFTGASIKFSKFTGRATSPFIGLNRRVAGASASTVLLPDWSPVFYRSMLTNVTFEDVVGQWPFAQPPVNCRHAWLYSVLFINSSRQFDLTDAIVLMVYVKTDENDPGHLLGADAADQQKFILCRTQINGTPVSVNCGKQ